MMSRLAAVAKAVLLCGPCVLAIAVPLYNGDTPRIAGFPLFYWALIALVPVSALAIYAAYRIDRAMGRA